MRKPSLDTRKLKRSAFDTIATKAAKAAGSSWAFGCAMFVVVTWAATGPLFNFSETWQLVINTGTTIVTFLMVFLIQKAQNKDSLAIQLKLNELVASHEYASNRLVDVEGMTEDEMLVIQKYYVYLSKLTKKEESLRSSHSIDEAKEQHEFKESMQKDQDEEIDKVVKRPMAKKRSASAKTSAG